MRNRGVLQWLVPAVAAAILALAAYLLLVWRPAQPGYTGERPAFRAVALRDNRTYQVTLWDFAYPVAGESYAARVSGWAKAFERAHPNIRIDVRLLPPGDPEGALRAALGAGRPPDVFAAPSDWAVMASRWLVPLAPYLNSADGRTLPGRVSAPSGPAVRLLAGAAPEGGSGPAGSVPTPAAFPRWIALWWWVADTRSMPDALKGPTAFDTGQAMANAAGSSARASATSAAAGGTAVAMDAGGERAVLEALAAAGPDVNAWIRAATVLQAARPLAGDGALVRFASGAADLLAGATPPVLSQIRRRLPWAAPVAAPGAKDPQPLAGAAGVYVFYQRPYGGVEHTEAAVQAASAYSRWRDDQVADALGVLPADPDAARAFMAAWPEAWRRASEWALANVGNGHFHVFPPDWPDQAANAWHAVRPDVIEWSTGKDVHLPESVRSAWAVAPASR